MTSKLSAHVKATFAMNVTFPLCAIWALVSVSLAGPPQHELLGTGFSTEAYFQSGFGFAISHPPEFAPRPLEGPCTLKATCSQVEFVKRAPSPRFDAQDAAKPFFQIEFAAKVKTGVAGQDPLGDLNQLQREIQARLPNLKWQPITQVEYSPGFIAHRSNGRMNEIYTAFLTAPEQVVLIRTAFSHGSSEAWSFGNMLESVRRMNQPPRVVSVTAESQSVKAGGQSCWNLAVDDVSGFLGRESLKNFALAGESPKSPWKKVEFFPPQSNLTTVQFRVCHEVTLAMSQRELLPIKMEFENLVGASSICEIKKPNEQPWELECSLPSSKLKISPPTTSVTKPDRSAPKIQSATISEDGLLELRATDQSKFESLQVIMNESNRQVYAIDGVVPGDAIRVQLSSSPGFGRSTLKALALSDEHGWMTLLKLDPESGFYAESVAPVGPDTADGFIVRRDLPALSFWRKDMK